MFTYRLDRSYDWNYAHGPSFRGPFPAVPETPLKDFFGIPVRSRIGIAAGLLLNSKWIRVYARLGFDILTYKTVRERLRRCYPLPNWVILDDRQVLDARRPSHALYRARRPPRDSAAITSSVSFGMPSRDPEVWTADVRRARRSLRPGQALVVSVVASPRPGDRPESMVDEFERLAGLAAGAGAQVVEANLSCPNVCSAEGDIYQDAGLSGRIAEAMRRAAGKTPLTLKAGYFSSPRKLKAFLRAVSGKANGVVLVNGISRRVLNADGSPAFGPDRPVSGILGRGIHKPCLANVKAAVEAIEKDRLELKVLAVGGVLGEADAKRYFDAGASAVLLGGGPMYDPGLACRFKEAHAEW